MILNNNLKLKIITNKIKNKNMKHVTRESLKLFHQYKKICIKKTKNHLSKYWKHTKLTTTTNGVGNLGSGLGQAQKRGGIKSVNLNTTPPPLDNCITNGNDNSCNKSNDVLRKNKIHFQIIFMILLVSWRITWSVVVSLKLPRQWSSPELKDTNWNTPLCSPGR